MEDVQSYFTWNDCSSESEDFLRSQIKEIETTIKSEEAKEKQTESEGENEEGIEGENEEGDDKPRNLPQLYALKAYLHARLKDFKKAESCFNAALKKCNKDNEGYKKVIYESLAHLCTLRGKEKKENGEKYGPCDAEVFAMRAHSAAYLQNNQDAIDFYEEALKIRETPEWCFGLALALNAKSVGRTFKADTDKIESLYRHAIQLDKSYDLAKLKAADELSKGDHRKEEVNNLVDPIINKFIQENKLLKEQTSVPLIEEAANAIKSFKPEDAEKLFLKCYETKFKSQKTIRGLGLHYSKLWGEGKEEENLKKAIKFLTENSDTGKHFDITLIAEEHRKAYDHYKSDGNESQKKDHEEKCKEFLEKLINKLDDGTLDTKAQIEVCFRLAKIYRTFSKLDKEKDSLDKEKDSLDKEKDYLDKEKDYLFKALACASKGTEEDNFKKLTYVESAVKRLLEIADKTVEVVEEGYEIKSKVFELSGKIQSAIFYFKKSTTEETMRLEMRVKEAQLFLSLIKEKRKNGLDDKQAMTETKSKIKAISKMVDQKDKNDQEVQEHQKEENKKLEELEILFQQIKIEKLLTDEILMDLGEACKNFEESKTRKQIFGVLDKTKVVLDRSMTYIKPLFPDGKPTIYYPSKFDFKDCPRKDLKINRIDSKFKNDFKWNEGPAESRKLFSHKLPKVANLFTEFLDIEEYEFLPKFIEIRNTGQHDFEKKQIEVLEKYYPKTEDQRKLARDTASYAVEVWNCVKEEVDKYTEENKK